MEITDIDSFLQYYSKVKFRTRRLFDYIPENKLEWSFGKGRFTIGDTIRHLANTERYMFAENAQFKLSRYDGCGEKYAQGLAHVVNYYDEMHEESLAIFSKLTVADLNEKCTLPSGGQITLWKWLRAMVEHEIHHRGQLYLYLGLLGVETPPIYGMTSEELARQSINNTSTKMNNNPFTFDVVFYLKGTTESLIEIKRTDIESEEISKIYHWLLIDEANHEVTRLIFVSMRTVGEVEEREFTEGKLVFNSQMGQFFQHNGRKDFLKTKSGKKIPKAIRKAIVKFFVTA
ncbi:MAG: DinB family protein [Bacteroidota bacterium]